MAVGDEVGERDVGGIQEAQRHRGAGRNRLRLISNACTVKFAGGHIGRCRWRRQPCIARDVLLELSQEPARKWGTKRALSN